MSVRGSMGVTRNVPIIQTGEIKYPGTRLESSGQRLGDKQYETRRRDFLWDDNKDDLWSQKKDNLWSKNRGDLWNQKRDNQNKDDLWKQNRHEGNKQRSNSVSDYSSYNGIDQKRDYPTKESNNSEAIKGSDGVTNQRGNVWTIPRGSGALNQWKNNVSNEKRASSVPVSLATPHQYRASSLPPIDHLAIKEKEKLRKEQRRNVGLDLSNSFRRPRQCEQTLSSHQFGTEIKKVNNLQRAVSENFLTRIGEDRSNMYVTRETFGQEQCPLHTHKGSSQTQVKTKKMELKFGMENLKTPAILKLNNILPKEETSSSSSPVRKAHNHRKLTPHKKSPPSTITENTPISTQLPHNDISITQTNNNRELRRRALEQKLVSQAGDLEKIGILNDTLEEADDSGDVITYNIMDGKEGITITTPKTPRKATNSLSRGPGRWSLREPNSSKKRAGINRTKSNEGPRFGSLRGLPPLWPSISSIPSYFRRPSLPEVKREETDGDQLPSEKTYASILKLPGCKKSCKKHVEFVDNMDTMDRKQLGARHY